MRSLVEPLGMPSQAAVMPAHEDVAALALLALAAPGWEAVERHYRKALDSVADDPGESVVEAAAAIEAMRTAEANSKRLFYGPAATAASAVAGLRDMTHPTPRPCTPATENDALLAIRLAGSVIVWQCRNYETED